MSNQPLSATTAGTGDPARPGGGEPSPILDTTSKPRNPIGTDGESGNPTGGPEMPPAPEPQADATPAAASSSRWRRAATLLTGVAAGLAVFSSGVLYADLHNERTAQAAPAPQVIAPARAVPAPAAAAAVVAPSNVPLVTRPAGAARGAPPVRISIPALKINQRLVGLRVRADRQLEVPADYRDIGWWSTGPVAGDPGAAVVVGHVDSLTGPAVFYRLSSLTKGAAIAVRRADGTTVKFAVVKVQSFSKRHFPDKLVYRTKGKSSLHLVTCGGSYDHTTGYRDNVVVFADEVQPRPTTKRKPSPTHKVAAKSRAAAKPGAGAKPKAGRSTKKHKAAGKAHHKVAGGRASHRHKGRHHH